MNLLVLSCGRRCDVIENLREELHASGGRLICADMSAYAPALYHADEHVVLSKDLDDPHPYIEAVMQLCRSASITAVMTLIDPELILLCKYRQQFLDQGVRLVLSGHDTIQNTFDKLAFHRNYRNNVDLLKTYGNREDALEAVRSRDVDLPLIAKPVRGSGSEGINVIHYENEFLTLKYVHKYSYIFQEYFEGKEIGIDAYFDMISGQLVSIFMKEKIAMRSGETDKAVSVYDEAIVHAVRRLAEVCDFRGPIDIDVFLHQDGRVVINEVNPRFGGGYAMAHACGVDFAHLLANNLHGNENPESFVGYPVGASMMKYPRVFVQS